LILSIDIGHNGAIVAFNKVINKVELFYSIPTFKRQTGMRDVRKRVGKKLVPTGERVPKMKTEYDLPELMRIPPLSQASHLIKVCLLENVHAMPLDGGAQLSALMYGKGLYHGIMLANRIPAVFLSPQKWKRGVGILREGKKGSITKFTELVQSKKILLCDAFDGLKLWDGLTDAILMAYYYSEENK